MPRISQVKPKSVRADQIKKRLDSSSTSDSLPVWEGEKSIQCKVIKIPLDHLRVLLLNKKDLIPKLEEKYFVCQNNKFLRFLLNVLLKVKKWIWILVPHALKNQRSWIPLAVLMVIYTPVKSWIGQYCTISKSSRARFQNINYGWKPTFQWHYR